MRVRLSFAALAIVLTGGPAWTQPAPPAAPAASIDLPPIDVTARPLLPGLPDLDKVPSNAQVFNRDDISRSGYPSALRLLLQPPR